MLIRQYQDLWYIISQRQRIEDGRCRCALYEEVTQRAGSLRSLTGLTEMEVQALLPYFEQAFEAYMGNRTIDGHPRTSRRYRTYATCPLPTMADKLLFILTYLKQNPIQELQGQLFGMSQNPMRINGFICCIQC